MYNAQFYCEINDFVFFSLNGKIVTFIFIVLLRFYFQNRIHIKSVTESKSIKVQSQPKPFSRNNREFPFDKIPADVYQIKYVVERNAWHIKAIFESRKLLNKLRNHEDVKVKAKTTEYIILRYQSKIFINAMFEVPVRSIYHPR